MSSIESIISEIENLTFSDKIVVLEGLSKFIKKSLPKNVKLSKEEKEAKPKRVVGPNPWNAFIEKIITEQPDLFEGVAKRAEKVKIVSEYKKEHNDEYEEFSTEFYKVHPKPEKEVKEKKPKAKKVDAEESGNESSSSSKSKASPKASSSHQPSVSDKAAELKKKLAEKKAAKPNNDGSEEVKPKKAVKAVPKKQSPKPSTDNEEEGDNTEVEINGKKYNLEKSTQYLWDEEWTPIGVYQPSNKKNPIRECEYSSVSK
jgi:hypothetical protein